MKDNHRGFFKFLLEFKVMLQEQKSPQNHHQGSGSGSVVDLRYLLFRLDFNEYYHVQSVKQEEEVKKRLKLRNQQNHSRTIGGDSMDQECNYEDPYYYEDQEDEDEEDDG